jgi:hypothetical protein
VPPFSIQSCRSCYARLYLCQRPFYKILVKVRNSKKKVLKNPVISCEWGKDREVFTTSGTYPWLFVTQIFHNGQPSKIFEVMTSTLPKGTLGSVASLLAATLYHGNPNRNHKLWNIVSSERYILHMQVLLECCYI